jgi:hypothetical protein
VPAAVFIIEMCHELFPSNDAVRQHLQSSVATGQQPLACFGPVTPLPQECQYCGLLVLNIADHISSHLTIISGLIMCLYTSCKRSRFAATELKNHMLSHKSQLSDYCLVCGRFFSTLPTLLNHRRLHPELLQFTCDFPDCNYIGNVDLDLQVHKLTAHSATAGICHLCSRHLSKNLKLHFTMHMTEMPGVYRCVHRICATRSFTTIAALKNHVQDEHRKLLLCDICGCSFVSSITLATHKLQHTQERQFPCQFPGCSLSFDLMRSLRVHMQIIHDEDGSECKLCGKVVLQWRHFWPHVLKHKSDTVGVVNCAFARCEGAFPSAAQLKLHVNSCHRREVVTKRLLRCDVCTQCFKRVDKMELHIVKHLKRSFDPKMHLPTYSSNYDLTINAVAQEEEIKIEEVVFD